MIHWPSLVLQPQWLHRLDRMAARRFTDDATAAEASTFVIEQLSADDWRRCRSFSGDSRPQTWLYSVAANLMEEFARKRYGRVRPPAWLAQQGQLWIGIWRSLCLERQMPQAIIGRLCGDGSREPELIGNIIRTLKARLPWCGVSHLPIPAEYSHHDGGERVSTIDHQYSAPSAEHQLLHALEEDMLALLRSVAGLGADGAAGTLDHLRTQLQLDDDERLLLQLHFQEGLSALAIARLLGVPNHQPGRQIRKLLARLRQVFANHDLLSEPPAFIQGETA